MIPRLRWALLGALLLWGFYQAASRAWVSDDAFISFRYAKNLASGEGLVFNRGERVEGYSNFLWTLALAGALPAGLDPVPVSQALGIAAFLATGLLLGLRRGEGEAAREVLPLAALGYLVHREAQVWATGGLETAAFTLAATATLVLAARARTARRAAAAGTAGVVTALLRPDGLLLLGVAGAVLAGFAFLGRSEGGRPLRAGRYPGEVPSADQGSEPGDGSRRGRSVSAIARRVLLRSPARILVAYGLPAVLVYLPYWLWRFAYYGDPLPNTYYAKSAGLPYWEQGFRYVALFVETHPALALVPVALLGGLGAAAASRAVRDRLGEVGLRELALAAAFVVAYGAYVARVGGDFMFGRFLVPLLPAAMIGVEVALRALPGRPAARAASDRAPAEPSPGLPQPGVAARGGTDDAPAEPRPGRWRAAVRPVLAVAFAAACLVRTGTFEPPGRVHHGIAYEPAWYPPAANERAKDEGRRLAPYVRDPDMVAGYSGTKAMLAYYAEVPVAIELDTGLTDRFIARQPLGRRGRPGHEKPAPPAYLVERGACILLRAGRPRRPVQRIAFDGVEATLFFYCRDFLAGAAAKGGVEFTRFPEYLDAYLERLGEKTDEEIAEDFRFFRAFYFAHNPDPERERRFAARLGIDAPSRIDSPAEPMSRPEPRR